MSIFKKILDTVFDTTQQRADFTRELCEHLRRFGVTATVVDPRTVEDVEGSYAYGLARVEDRNIDFVEINRDIDGDRESSFYCTFHTRGTLEGHDDAVDVEGESTRKGLLSRRVVDYQWTGGSLAPSLNADAALKAQLLAAQAGHISVKPSPRFHGIVSIRHGNTTWGGAWKKRAFPTREAFEIYDRIAHHIRTALNPTTTSGASE